MRRLMMATAIAALAGAGSLIAGSAQALPGAGGLPGSHDAGLVEKTQVVCPRAYWNGYAWVQPPCRRVIAAPLFAPAPPPPPLVVVRPYRRHYRYYYR